MFPFAGSIYGIRRLGDPEFRYVGQTRGTVTRRRTQHLKSAKTGTRLPVYDWIRKFESDEDLYFQPLEVVMGGDDELDAAEIRWVRRLREDGHRLLNMTDGGGGQRGNSWSAERRRLASEQRRGRKGKSYFGPDNPMWGREHSPERRARWSESRRGSNTGARNPNYGKFGPEHPSYGHEVSEETRALLSEQKLGAKNPNFGKSASEETRAKMSAARKGRPMPSSVRSAHTRYHTNTGVFKATCRHCVEDQQANRIQGNEER